MATFVATGCRVEVNGVDLSDHVESVELDDEFDEQDFTNFGSGGNQEVKAGIGKGQIAITFQQDYAASKVDATLWAARGTVVAVNIRPTQSAISSTNPEYQASYLVKNYKPLSGKVGEKATSPVTWTRSGALTRDTTP